MAVLVFPENNELHLKNNELSPFTKLGSLVSRTVTWLKGEGESKAGIICRKIAAYVLSIFLVISVLGIAFLVEGIHHWNAKNSKEIVETVEAGPSQGFGIVASPGGYFKENNFIPGGFPSKSKGDVTVEQTTEIGTLDQTGFQICTSPAGYWKDGKFVTPAKYVSQGEPNDEETL
jgi:hypothetical protein